MRLAIISHTAHYKTDEGEIVGWGPTITEINHLIEKFDKIYHVAFFHDSKPPKSAMPYTSSKIEFVALPLSGGKSVFEKAGIITRLPKTIKTVNSILKKVDVFQFRAPVGIGVYLIPWLLLKNKRGWFKYAGNWSQENPPLGYALQRKMLKRQNKKVTVNGTWPNQKKHIIPFENPCLSNNERQAGKENIAKKTYKPPFTFCFVGRLEDEKGVQRIIDAFLSLTDMGKMVNKIHLVGTGKKDEVYKNQIKDKSSKFIFHGALGRSEVFEIYQKSDFFLLPSTASEGFPKAIAEAMNYGCVPIVSSVSSIKQYLDIRNSYIVSPVTSERLAEIIMTIFKGSAESIKSKAKEGHKTSKNFTFEHYNQRIWTEILEQATS